MMKAGEECVFESAPANYVDFELRFLGPQSHSLIGSFHRWLHVSGNFRLFSFACDLLSHGSISGGPTLVTNQHFGSKELGSKGWLVHPRSGRFVMRVPFPYFACV